MQKINYVSKQQSDRQIVAGDCQNEDNGRPAARKERVPEYAIVHEA